MIYGILRFINFAHGDVFMIGAFSGYYLGIMFAFSSGGGGTSLALAILILLGAMAITCLGFTIEKLAYKPLRKSPKLTILITAIGVSLFRVLRSAYIRRRSEIISFAAGKQAADKSIRSGHRLESCGCTCYSRAPNAGPQNDSNENKDRHRNARCIVYPPQQQA